MNEYMEMAVLEAKKAFDEGNVPVGAVIVRNNVILSYAHNMKNTSNISVYHAEILCIIDACKKIGSWYLDDCFMYVTLEPCEMCKAAIAESRIKKVFYLSKSNYFTNLANNMRNTNYECVSDVFEYQNLLSDFFKRLRD